MSVAPGQRLPAIAQSSRSARMTSSRTARRAGKRPPKTPMASVITTATVMTSGPKRNETVTSAKVFDVARAEGQGAERERGQQAERAAQRAEQDRLAQERDQDVEPGEAQGTHRADLAGPGADGGEHRVGRGEHRADRQEDGDQGPGPLEEQARPRLVRRSSRPRGPRRA